MQIGVMVCPDAVRMIWACLVGSLLVSVQVLRVEGCDVSDALSLVSEVLDSLDRCGSPVLQSICVLESSSSDADARIGALDVFRGLS